MPLQDYVGGLLTFLIFGMGYYSVGELDFRWLMPAPTRLLSLIQRTSYHILSSFGILCMVDSRTGSFIHLMYCF